MSKGRYGGAATISALSMSQAEPQHGLHRPPYRDIAGLCQNALKVRHFVLRLDDNADTERDTATHVGLRQPADYAAPRLVGRPRSAKADTSPSRCVVSVTTGPSRLTIERANHGRV